MTKSRANWHAIVALAIVTGAECAGLKDETAAQLALHGPFFWVCLVCAIVVGFGNSIISTKPSTSTPPNETPKNNPVVSPAPPGAAV